MLEVVLELHREKDDGAKHQLPNRPQLERGGTHLTTSENHRRLSAQSECSVMSPRANQTASSTLFFSSNFSSPFNHTHSRFFRSINSPVCYLYHPCIRYSHFSASSFVSNVLHVNHTYFHPHDNLSHPCTCMQHSSH